MSEELKDTPETENPVVETETVSPVQPNEEIQDEALYQENEPDAEVQPDEFQETETVEPKVIIKKERGFAYFVGFALLCVLCICFFFMPGICITYAVTLIPGVTLGAIAAWTFSTILSFVVWLIFKLKIKGFLISFYWYIGLCVLLTLILLVIQCTSETNVFSELFTLLSGGTK